MTKDSYPVGSFIPSIHDVGLAPRRQVESLLQLCEENSLERCALLVVPGALQNQEQSYRDWVVEKHAAGHELLLHGYLHWSAPNKERGRAWADRLTGGQAEFAGLLAHESQNRLELAWTSWNQLGLPQPIGFVPPTWHSNPFLKSQVFALGIPLYESRWAIHRHVGFFRGFPLSFAGLPWPVPQALAGASPWLPRWGLARLALHPSDLFTFPKNSLGKVIATWVHTRHRMDYSDLAS